MSKLTRAPLFFSPARRAGSAALLLALATCATTTPDGARVEFATERGPYLDATIQVSAQNWRLLFPKTEVCRATLRLDATVTYARNRGNFGRVISAAGDVCEPVGIGSLERWRLGRQPGEIAPSSQATWRIIYEDPEVLLLRGNFPLSNRVRLPNARDSVAMIANDDVCAPVARGGVSNLVFRSAGTPVLALGLCPVIAVAMPL